MMDPFVDEMSEAYKNLAAAAAAAAVIEARVAGGEVPRTAACDAALEELKERLELFRASCDRAEGAIDEAKRRAECELFFPAMGDGELFFPVMGDGELFFPAMGDGVGEADGPIAARENAVGDDDDIPSLTEMLDAGFVEAAPAMEKEAVGKDVIMEAVDVDVPIAAEAEGSAARENVVVCNIDTQEIIDAWVTFLS